MLILGIETSCDETAAAVIDASDSGIRVVSNIVSSQVKLHAEWGGVVPNLAAREHLKNILPVINEALEKASVVPEQIELIAVTSGPGLIPALLIGTTAAKTLSYLWEKPLIGIHHIEAHIYANFIGKNPNIAFPALALVVSGGHTQLVLMRDHLEYEIVGQTLDDAVGEAFDKVARILDLGYPGGPIVSEYAKRFSENTDGKEGIGLKFPRPMFDSKNFDFSFSGLKTAVLYAVKNNPQILTNDNFKQEACFQFQEAAIDTLVHKTLGAAARYGAETVILAGGVSANNELRARLGSAVKESSPEIEYMIPDIRYSGDNAAMIAAAAYYRWNSIEDKEALKENWKTIDADANKKLA